MKILIGIAACIFSIACFGQTKLISHRSHSGNNADFRTAVEHNLFDTGNSNFGIVVNYIEKVDTVILKGKNKIIILRETYYVEGRRNHRVSAVRDTLTRANEADFFSASSITDLKAQIHKKYKTAKLDSTLFIGFNKKFNKKG